MKIFLQFFFAVLSLNSIALAGADPSVIVPLITKASGVVDRNGKAVDRHFHMEGFYSQPGDRCDGFYQTYGYEVRKDCASVNGHFVGSDGSVNAHVSSEDCDAQFDFGVWKHKISVDEYYRCEDDNGNFIPMAQ
jgi:hypothetical protein